MKNWTTIIDQMLARSGMSVQFQLPEPVSSFIQDELGIELARPQQTLSSSLPSVRFEAGLTQSELSTVEGTYGLKFPPDLREFLQTALPLGEGFPDWRSGVETELRYWLQAPLDGILFDVEHNGFWLPEWGERPATLADALGRASALIATAPNLNTRLRPQIYSGRTARERKPGSLGAPSRHYLLRLRLRGLSPT